MFGNEATVLLFARRAGVVAKVAIAPIVMADFEILCGLVAAVLGDEEFSAEWTCIATRAVSLRVRAGY